MSNAYYNKRRELEILRTNNRVSYENGNKSYDEYSKEERKINKETKRKPKRQKKTKKKTEIDETDRQNDGKKDSEENIIPVSVLRPAADLNALRDLKTLEITSD